MPVSERQQFDVGDLQDFLRDKLPGFTGPLTVEQFKGGQSNPTFKLTDPNGAWVMRCKPAPADKLLKSAHAIDREYKVLDALADTDVPVAKVFVLCEDESVIGRAFYIMECVEGRILWEQSLPNMAKRERAAIYEEMNRVIANLHLLDYNKIGLGDFGRPGNYFARQIDRWTKQYRISETQKIPAMDNLIDWLPQNIPEGDETSIVHGDYRLDNIMFHPEKPEAIAVLDWELSTIGHPLADFSYHCMGFHIAPGQFRGIAGLDLAALGIPSEQEYIARYCERTGRDHIDNWAFYLAYNMFRLSGILQGIVKRAQDGTAASDQAAQAGARARPLAEMGWAIVQHQINK
ncbi:MAG: phosphotransferase family protein [Burkholderiaceae bacterium]